MGSPVLLPSVHQHFPTLPPHTRRDEVFEEEEEKPEQEAETPVTESESDGGDDDDDEAEEEAGADRLSSVTGSRYSWTIYFGGHFTVVALKRVKQGILFSLSFLCVCKQPFVAIHLLSDINGWMCNRHHKHHLNPSNS